MVTIAREARHAYISQSHRRENRKSVPTTEKRVRLTCSIAIVEAEAPGWGAVVGAVLPNDATSPPFAIRNYAQSRHI